MDKFWKWTIIVEVTAIIMGIGAFAFFRYMSFGALISWPRGSEVTVAFADNKDVELVMSEICHEFPSEERKPTVHESDYYRLLATGVIAKAPDGTPILFESRGGIKGQPLSIFQFRAGRWKGRNGWTCPGSIALYHPYP